MERVAIVRDAETGEAVVAGTGVTVAEILRELAGGPGIEAVLRRHPELTEEAVAAAVSFASAAVQREARYDADTPERAPGIVREAPVAAAAPARAGSVVLGVEEYEDLLDQIEFLTELNQAQLEVAEGKTVSHEEARAYLLSRLGG
ncbi:MAG TPA: DUF433 domain-containing protein [Longimicrobium sp.]|jgi:uncharacterized protein (DUF433 family)